MLFEPKVISLKNGTTCTLRTVEAGDAEAMISYLREVSFETPFLLRNGDEITYTQEQEEEIIRKRMEHPRELMMVAEVDGVMAGNCGFTAIGRIPQSIRYDDGSYADEIMMVKIL